MALLSSPNRWWQNWSKTHAYVAQTMFYPSSVTEIGEAIRLAESDKRPVRAVGGGWSFSDASLPAGVTTNRPNVYAIDAISAMVPQASKFPSSKRQASVTSIVRSPILDIAGKLAMVHATMQPLQTGPNWIYTGAGAWIQDGNVRGGPTDTQFLVDLAQLQVRPVRIAAAGKTLDESDLPGSLVMHNQAAPNPMLPLRDWFYNGGGLWSVGIAGDAAPPVTGTLANLARDGRLLAPGIALSPRLSDPGESLMLLLAKQPNTTGRTEPVYLINTRSMTGSLQHHLPKLLSTSAADAFAEVPTDGKPRRHLFHVEAGITIAELGELLAHQAPRLSLQAISGSPGATLAGALATATHGAEFNWTLLIDRIKAIHLVGPGGLEWWIEGTESIADPTKLLALHAGLSPDRIITGTAPMHGILPQDWLKAAVVSMGSMGVLYSAVLDVVPIFGVHEVVVQRTWRTMGFVGNKFPEASRVADLRNPARASELSERMVTLMQRGSLNGTGIDQTESGVPLNRYADLAINPNARLDGDFDTWVGNREMTDEVPIDPNPASTNDLIEMAKGVGSAFSTPGVGAWPASYLNSPESFIWDVLTHQGLAGSGTGGLAAKINRLQHASDIIDVGLDAFLTPLESAQDGFRFAQAVLTGLLAGMLGTANQAKLSDKTGLNVGALGFPASGIMGTGLEIALAPADAFGFIQTQILDVVNPRKPFLGYISVRLCSPTDTHMGMQQFSSATNPLSVMIEVVGFGNDDCRAFISDLERRTVNLIAAGKLEAMLHWGLENEQFNKAHLHTLKALQRPTPSGLNKLDSFKAVRALIQAASPATFRAFDNAFTARLGLDAAITDEPYDFGHIKLHEARPPVRFHFRNDGLRPLQMVLPTVDGDFRTAATSGEPANLLIAPIALTANPGDEVMVDVTFAAEQVGAHAGTLTILTSVPGVPDSVKVVRIRLHAIVDHFAVSLVNPTPPGTVDLGSVPLSEYRTTPVEIRNDGTIGAVLDSYELGEPDAVGQVWIEEHGIAAGETKTYLVTYGPNAVGPLATQLTLHFRDPNPGSIAAMDLVLQLQGTGIGVQAELSPATVRFAGQVVLGTESGPEAVVLRNVGNAPLIVSGMLMSSGFRLLGPPPTTIEAGQSEKLEVVFRPGLDGPVTGSLSISSNSANPPVPVILEGVGLRQALLVATPSPLEFRTVAVGSTSGEHEISVRNGGSVPVELRAMKVAGPDARSYILGNSRIGGAILAPEASIPLTIAFAPEREGTIEAALEVEHDGLTSPLVVAIVGQGEISSGLLCDVSELDFGPIAVNGRSAPRQVVVTNIGAETVKIADVSLFGAGARDFVLVDLVPVPAALEPGEGLKLDVEANPTLMGARDASLVIAASSGDLNVALRAVGLDTVVQWSAALVDFAEWKVGATSTKSDAYLRNTGNTPIVVTLVDSVGDFTVQDQGPQYMTIPPNGEKYFSLWFKPTDLGTRSGALQVHVSGTANLLSLALTGVGR